MPPKRGSPRRGWGPRGPSLPLWASPHSQTCRPAEPTEARGRVFRRQPLFPSRMTKACHLPKATGLSHEPRALAGLVPCCVPGRAPSPSRERGRVPSRGGCRPCSGHWGCRGRAPPAWVVPEAQGSQSGTKARGRKPEIQVSVRPRPVLQGGSTPAPPAPPTSFDGCQQPRGLLAGPCFLHLRLHVAFPPVPLCPDVAFCKDTSPLSAPLWPHVTSSHLR